MDAPEPFPHILLTIQCVADAYQHWNMTNRWDPPVYYNPIGKQSCCFGLEAFDCYESGASQTEQIAVKKFIQDTITNQSHGDCVNYQYHSKHCQQ
ncbi:unnamed protein product [Medioppia subpectinata]|uniref:Uncharacterized protein n=1 Tax=Medioppia subpectinata TaxID=1979941 RepID=A0A7R9PY13_9ACAR|nr:unnamed protein product [Medioppia subpectinata]CAG2104950.1 unnamed protein product [Medioppia subpectinata]